jgi:hypothetical protein
MIKSPKKDLTQIYVYSINFGVHQEEQDEAIRSISYILRRNECFGKHFLRCDDSIFSPMLM